MVEIINEHDDFFFEYRKDPIANDFISLKKQISQNIPSDFEPHCVEWMVLKHRFIRGDIDSDQLGVLTRKFSIEHDSLFDNGLFVIIIKQITDRLGTVV